MMNRSKLAAFAGAAVVVGAALTGCGGGSNSNVSGFSANTAGLTSTNGLITFNSASPGSSSATRAITGLNGGDTLVGFDVRPANGELYALGSQGRLYQINQTTLVASQVGPQFTVPLAGTAFGFDFNPTVDRIRIVSNTGQNLRVNPDTGAVVDTDPVTAGAQIDGNLAYAPGDVNFGTAPNVVAVGYTNSVAGAATTTLFGIDTNLDVLVSINANAGVLTTLGALGVNANNNTGFEIQGTSTTGLAVFNVGGVSTISSINLTTGTATTIGTLATPNIVGITALP